MVKLHSHLAQDKDTSDYVKKATKSIFALDICMTLCEVSRHNEINDCWIIANNNIYDATFMVPRHPGGKDAIMSYAGGKKDASEAYNMHSDKAKKMWDMCFIGKLRDG